ncbi:probable serine hydrolase [Chironomus tepperi]|uniref:probable serine hydrolase n=1 Tax=Chironomus tepperi TaxID=113505 RepID=UPI00391F33BA
MEEFEAKVQKDEEEFEVAEVKINLQTGGYIAGRFWGNKSVQPFVCIHGWQDNAGSFDRLIPLLPKQYSYLAIDLPGHGKSSWLPNGVPYHNFDFVNVLTLLMKEYKWDKINIIGHSLGGYIAFFFAAVFPNKVNKIISIDALKPNVYSANRLIDALQQTIENFPIADQRNVDGDFMEYTYAEMIDKIANGFLNSVSKEAVPYVLRRGALPSKKQPGKYYFSRDGRLRYNYGFYLGHSMYIELASQIKLPYLIIKAANFPITEDHEYFNETLSAMKTNPNFEYHEIDTFSHHLHLTEPERIVGIIRDFLEKHEKVDSHL